MTGERDEDQAAVGATIRHPDLREPQVVRQVRPCQGGGAPHAAYVVRDSDWGETWVCSLQAQLVEP